jgi:hypothetical protein
MIDVVSFYVHFSLIHNLQRGAGGQIRRAVVSRHQRALLTLICTGCGADNHSLPSPSRRTITVSALNRGDLRQDLGGRELPSLPAGWSRGIGSQEYVDEALLGIMHRATSGC